MAINSDQYLTGSNFLTQDIKKVSAQVKGLLLRTLEAEGGDIQLYHAARHLIEAGGKMLRPYLVMKCCELIGGRSEEALPAAAAVEFLHTFTLIHDDIIDQDDTRRGVPTVHTRWGVPTAIIAGDLLFAHVYKMLVDAKIPAERVIKVISFITQAAVKLCEGQMLDITFPRVESVTGEEYMEMIDKKTSYLFKTAAEVGAVIGGASEDQLKRLGNFASLAGLGFQIMDDILGLTADEQKLGKPVGSDIREGKKTILVIYALQRAETDERAAILKALQGKASQKDILRARDIIVAVGAIDYASEKAQSAIKAALKQLDIFPDNPAKASLTSLAHLLVNRDF